MKKISWWMWRFGNYLTIIVMDYVEQILETSTWCIPRTLQNSSLE